MNVAYLNIAIFISIPEDMFEIYKVGLQNSRASGNKLQINCLQHFNNQNNYTFLMDPISLYTSIKK
jgi:hypothetical protein